MERASIDSPSLSRNTRKHAMRQLRLLPLIAPCALALGLSQAVPVRAAEEDPRFTLRLGAMDIDTDNTIRGSTVIGGQPIDLSEDFGMGGKELEPRVDGLFRISDRQRLIFDYFKYDQDRRETLGETLSYGDTTVPAGSFVKGELKYQVATLVYDYSVVDSEKFDLGLQLG